MGYRRKLTPSESGAHTVRPEAHTFRGGSSNPLAHLALDSVSSMLEYVSSMTDAAATSLNARIADRVRELRAARGLSLDALATRYPHAVIGKP